MVEIKVKGYDPQLLMYEKITYFFYELRPFCVDFYGTFFEILFFWVLDNNKPSKCLSYDNQKPFKNKPKLDTFFNFMFNFSLGLVGTIIF